MLSNIERSYIMQSHNLSWIKIITWRSYVEKLSYINICKLEFEMQLEDNQLFTFYDSLNLSSGKFVDVLFLILIDVMTVASTKAFNFSNYHLEL